MSHLYFLQVQNAALAAMKDEMLELASRFTRVTKERDYMEKALNRLQVSNFFAHYFTIFKFWQQNLELLAYNFGAKLRQTKHFSLELQLHKKNRYNNFHWMVNYH